MQRRLAGHEQDQAGPAAMAIKLSEGDLHPAQAVGEVTAHRSDERAHLGDPDLVQTVVKRGYRLPVDG